MLKLFANVNDFHQKNFCSVLKKPFNILASRAALGSIFVATLLPTSLPTTRLAAPPLVLYLGAQVVGGSWVGSGALVPSECSRLSPVCVTGWPAYMFVGRLGVLSFLKLVVLLCILASSGWARGGLWVCLRLAVLLGRALPLLVSGCRSFSIYPFCPP